MVTSEWTLSPYEIVSNQNFTPNNVEYIRGQPEEPDTNGLAPVDPSVLSRVDLKFPIPGLLTGTQIIKVVYTDPNWVGLHIEILENGVIVHTSSVTYSGYNNIVNKFSWDASILSNRNGENVTVRVVGHAFNGLGVSTLDAVSWEATAEIIVRTGTGQGGFDAAPFNQHMFNETGTKHEGITALTGVGGLKANPVRAISVNSTLVATSNLSSVPLKIIMPVYADLKTESTINAYGIRRQEGSTLLRGFVELISNGISIPRIIANLSTESSLSAKPFKYGFASAAMESQSELEASSSLTFYNQVGLIASAILESESLRQANGISSIENDTNLQSFPTFMLGGQALLNGESEVELKPFLIISGSTNLQTDSQIESVYIRVISNESRLIIDSILESLSFMMINGNSSLYGLGNTEFYSIIKAISNSNLKARGDLLADSFLYRWIYEEEQQTDWEMSDKPSNVWEDVNIPMSDWKRVIK